MSLYRKFHLKNTSVNFFFSFQNGKSGISLPRDPKSRFVVVLFGSWKGPGKPVQGWGESQREWIGGWVFPKYWSRWFAVPSWAKAIAWLDLSLQVRLPYVRKPLCNTVFLCWRWAPGRLGTGESNRKWGYEATVLLDFDEFTIVITMLEECIM